MPRGRAPRCIVLAPTRELAKQVEREFAASAPGLNVGCFYGGQHSFRHGIPECKVPNHSRPLIICSVPPHQALVDNLLQ